MGQVSSLLWGPSWTPSRQIRIENGLIEGKRFEVENNLTVDAFLGIPFAKPPVGPLRFKKPEPAENWEGVRDCTKFGARCPHEDISIERLTVFHPKSEDCLFLNVFTPVTSNPNDEQEKLPVAVFIHGGAFAVHSSAHYGDYGICKILCSKNIIVVTIQYRLGFFGFLSTGDEHCPGNFGLWDQTLALKWVQNNIHSFHGDPNNVTLFGQSAGGASVDFLSLSPHSKTLFHKMMPMSGTSLCSFANNDPEHIRELSLKYALRHGYIPPADKNQSVQNAALVEFFRQLPASSCELNILGPNNDGRVDLTPVFDNDFFPKPLAELRKELVPVPTMTGVTKTEGLLFTGLILFRIWQRQSLTTAIKPPRGSFKEEIRRQIIFEFQKRWIHDHTREKEVFDLYLSEAKRDRRSYMEACLALISELIISNGVYELADFLTHKGGEVYLYSFDYYNPYGFGLAGFMFPFKSSTHCSEIPYLFGRGLISNFSPNQNDLQMIEMFSTYFTNFVKYGNPNGKVPKVEEKWKPLHRSNTKSILLN
ncbi:Carboxylic ester hydrolase [Aphelenchoides bicaudatus]|nr:Carboxylic ester hydrolase [Aphelenchoides bicaudatus]